MQMRTMEHNIIIFGNSKISCLTKSSKEGGIIGSQFVYELVVVTVCEKLRCGTIGNS